METTFNNYKLSKGLLNAIADLGFEQPTPIQEESFSVILSGKDMVGIAQTGTGKTLAYMLPLLRDLKFSEQINPRILVLVPTHELVAQSVEMIQSFTKYTTLKVYGIHGGANINTQKKEVALGADIIVATPGRLYDLALTNTLKLKDIKKLVIDEVDVMLDLGFRFQLKNIFELLPSKRQNIMFSATMTEEIDELINDFFIAPEKITIAFSGTPLSNISQTSYSVPNFYTKINLLQHLLKDKEVYNKVVIFVSSKKNADKLFEKLELVFNEQVGIIHANKTQNFRAKAIEDFENNSKRILVATDVIARGLDLDKISHVINMDTPLYPENYIHRIGRTGRKQEQGQSVLLFTDAEEERKEAIELLMDYQIPVLDFPEEVAYNSQLLLEEKRNPNEKHHNRNTKKNLFDGGGAFHEKIDKNKKTNQGGSYRRKLAEKYKKPKTKGDKNYNKGRRK